MPSLSVKVPSRPLASSRLQRMRYRYDIALALDTKQSAFYVKLCCRVGSFHRTAALHMQIVFLQSSSANVCVRCIQILTQPYSTIYLRVMGKCLYLISATTFVSEFTSLAVTIISN